MDRDSNDRFTSLKAGSTDSQAIADYYDDWAKSYDATLATWEYAAPEDAAALIAPHLPAGAETLDVGCGTGLVSEALGRHGRFRLHGIDISAASLKLAEERGTYETLVCHDLQQQPLPLADDAYEAAISVGVLTYIEDAGALFRDLCRCVRSGGVIGFTQRTDRWQDRDFDTLIETLGREGLWTVEHVSEPHGYLPGNEDFADEIKIIHTLCRVV